MKRPVVTVSQKSIRWMAEALPVDLSTRDTLVIGGDWDLQREADAGKPESAGRFLLPVAIGRDGGILASRLSRYTAAGDQIPVWVAVRHQCWQNYRTEILAYSKRDGCSVYAPLTHIDLRDIPSWNDGKRARAIVRSISPFSRTVLDIGAHWGYMSEELEKTGRSCTALEVDLENFHFMTRLKRAQNFQYETVLGDIFDFIDKRNNFDAVLALAVFHHFTKTKDRHDRLLDLLEKVKAREMFVWSHNVREPQMRNAYRNYDPRQLAELIVNRSWFNSYVVIATIEFRSLMRFAHQE